VRIVAAVQLPVYVGLHQVLWSLDAQRDH